MNGGNYVMCVLRGCDVDLSLSAFLKLPGNVLDVYCVIYGHVICIIGDIGNLAVDEHVRHCLT